MENLEFKIEIENQKSRMTKSERNIADILDKYGIGYKYDKQAYISDMQNKDRMWYLDFYLLNKDIVVEYMGRRFKEINGKKIEESDENYNERVEVRRKVYEKMGFKYMLIRPEDMWANLKEGKPVYKKSFESYLINSVIAYKGSKGSKLKDAYIKTRAVPNHNYSTPVYSCAG
jgi:hypothetical protein